MAAQSPELQSKIATWRQRAIEGTLTLEEMKEAITAMRQDRVGASYASEGAATKRKAAKAAIPNADDLLSELQGL